MIILIQDFPHRDAGQNGSMLNWRKTEERARTRALGERVANQREYGRHFPAGMQLEVRVAALAGPGRRQHQMDVLNVPGMLKGYFDGFTDAGVWSDDRQVVDVRVFWMSPEEGAAWLRMAEVEDEGRGILVFHIKERTIGGSENSERTSADGGDAEICRGSRAA